MWVTRVHAVHSFFNRNSTEETFMPALKRRNLGVRLVLGLAACLMGVAGHAQSGADAYPNKPIRVVVPYPAGGTTDQLARSIAQPLQEILGQPIVVDNKPGAGGTIGADLVAKSSADGYTLLFGNSGPSATVSLMRKLPYDVNKDFRPLSAVVSVPLILAVAAESPHKNLKEFLAWARASGDKVNYGSTGVGGSSHLASEYFNELAGTKFQHIPYAGGAPLVTAFAAGQVQMAFVTGLDGAAMVNAGRIRYLAVASPKRTEVIPHLPAIAEEVPGFSAVVWFGLLAPRGVSDAIAEKLSAAIAKAVQRPEIRKHYLDRNVEPRGSSAQELARTIELEIEQWGPVIKRSNISIQ
jgi:tripartite-type tricarboxylate transporter receptor subunit TctC